MAEVSNPTGLGQDGYLNYQKETTYGSAASGTEIDLPVKEGSLLKAYKANIENNNIMASRMKQTVNNGQIIVDGQIVMDAYPTLIGALINQFLGAAVSTAVGADGAYNHYWFIPKTGVRIGKSMTINQAIGGVNLADTFTGVIIDSITITQDISGNTEVTFKLAGQNYAENTERKTTWTFPSAATNPPFMFGHALLTIVPAGGSQITTFADSWSITINLNHKLDRFKMSSVASGAKVSQPNYSSIPNVEISMNVDADQYFLEYARAKTKFNIIVNLTHTVSTCGTTPTYHKLAFEFPACLLKPDTEIPNSNDQINMDLSFDGSFGGTTTNGAAVIYMGEVRVTDAVAAYA